MKETSTCPSRLTRSLKLAMERLSRQQGTSINQFVPTAVAEKLATLETARCFDDRKNRADFKAFGRIMKWRAESDGGQAIKCPTKSVVSSEPKVWTAQ